MFIVIRHPINGKSAIYINRYDCVTQLSFELFEHSSGDCIQHHLYPFLSFLRYLRGLGYLISLHASLSAEIKASINLILSQDLSDYSIGITRSILLEVNM